MSMSVPARVLSSMPACVASQNQSAISELRWRGCAAAASRYQSFTSSAASLKLSTTDSPGNAAGQGSFLNAAMNRTASRMETPLAPATLLPRARTARSCQCSSRSISANRAAAPPASLFAGTGNDTGQAHGMSATLAVDSATSSHRVSGTSVRATRLKAASSTWCWREASPGSPKGRPSSKGTSSARGGRMASTCWGMRPTSVVAMPCASIQ